MSTAMIAFVLGAVAAIAMVVAALFAGRARAGGKLLQQREHEGAELAQVLEEVLAQTQLRDQVLGTMSEAVMLIERGAIVYANPAATEMLGARAGKPPPPQVPMIPGEPARFDVHHPAHRTMRSRATDLGGRTVIVAQDVTEAERIDQIRRDFVANASHEMKTPVAAILATAETLGDAIEDDPDAARRFATTLAEEAARLSRLIQDLLDLARLDQPPAEAAPADWSALVRDAIDDVRAAAEQKDLTLRSQIADGVIVRGRAHDLAQIPRNLLDNAINYTPSGGLVEVRLTADPSSATLIVLDTGIGIPTKELPRVFERFYRVDRARSRATGGTGLGLSIVRHVAEAHGGSVRVDSELGRGSRFTVVLPLTR